MKRGRVTILEVSEASQIDRVVSLAETIWREYFPQVISLGQIEYMLDRFLSHSVISSQVAGAYRYFLLCGESQPQGFMAIVPEEAALHVSKLYVLRSARGRGLARQAMVFLEGLCRKEGVDRLWLRVNIHNTLAIAVYERLGFHIADSLVEDIGGGFVMDDYVMEKRLTAC